MPTTTTNPDDSKGQSIARAVLSRLTKDTKDFNSLVVAQHVQCATMLGEDIGLEVDMVVKYEGELAIITELYLDPKSKNGISVRVESYTDDLKFAVILSEKVNRS